MSEYSLPMHLVYPAIFSLLVLCLIIYKRKVFFRKRKSKSLPISITIFFLIYFLILVNVIYLDHHYLQALDKFDLNLDNRFRGDEITTDYQEALNKVTNDTARLYAFITGAIFSFIIALFVFVVGKIYEWFRMRKIT